MSNVIILTTGLSGSSLVTGFIAKAGYWCGTDTVYKDNYSGKYETYENKQLVELNEQLFSALGINFSENDRFDSALFSKFTHLNNTIDLLPFKQFIDDCQDHGAWIWKDPRLMLTLGFWRPLLVNIDCKYVLVYRKVWNLWISMLNKRQIVHFHQLKLLENRTHKYLKTTIKIKGLPFHKICFDDFINSPREATNKINLFLNIRLTPKELDDVIDNKLLQSTMKLTHRLNALLIYLKNFVTLLIKS